MCNRLVLRGIVIWDQNKTNLHYQQIIRQGIILTANSWIYRPRPLCPTMTQSLSLRVISPTIPTGSATLEAITTEDII